MKSLRRVEAIDASCASGCSIGDNPDAAFRVVRGIYDKVQSLRQFPEIGYLYAARADHNVRVLLHGHYRIAYVIKPGGQIDILGIFHDALDIDRYL